MFYRKRPVMIEAFQYTGQACPAEAWARQAIQDGVITFTKTGEMNINMPEGVMRVDIGDYVIKGVKGEIYACHEDIFLQTYELVGTDATTKTKSEEAVK